MPARIPISVSDVPAGLAGIVLRGQTERPEVVFQQNCRAAVRGLMMNDRRHAAESPVKSKEYKGLHANRLRVAMHGFNSKHPYGILAGEQGRLSHLPFNTSGGTYD